MSMVRRAQITCDKRGMSVWPIEVNLRYDGAEWFDTECEVRGTNGGFDHEAVERLTGIDINLGQRIIVSVTVDSIDPPLSADIPSTTPTKS